MPALTQLMAAMAPADGGLGGPFDQITGLPVHPLVVHAVVVLVPLSVFGLLLVVLVPRLRAPVGWLVLLLMAGASGSSWVAIQSGQVLALRVGRPDRHADAGKYMFYLTAAMLVLSLLWYLTAQASSARRDRRERRAATAATAPIGTDPLTGRPLEGPAPTVPDQGGNALASVLAVLALAVGLLNLFWIYRVGSSGAEAVWKTQITPTATPTPSLTSPTPSPSPTTNTGSPTPSASPANYSMSQVSAHALATDCWAAIGESVYDLTEWIDQHPGGKAQISQLCGQDATTAFAGQHGEQDEPNSALAGLRIGALAAD